MRLEKRGSVSVSLTLILTVCLLSIAVITEAAIGKALRVAGTYGVDLAGRAVLSEYNTTLYQKYGLIGFNLTESEAKQKMQFYLENMFQPEEENHTLLRAEVGRIDIYLSDYVLSNYDLFETQINDTMKWNILMDGKTLFAILKEGRLLTEESAQPVADPSTERIGRHLRNERIISQLPTRLLEQNNRAFIAEIELEKLANLTTNTLSTNLYITKYFRHRLDEGIWADTFFVNEQEYILYGKLTDQENEESAKTGLLLFRTTMNLAHIYSDTEKREALAAAATLLTPGPEAIATQFALAGTWAGAEALIDLNKLERGGRVPLYKTASEWTLSLKQAVENQTIEFGTNQNDGKGLSYEEYLFILLCFLDREQKLARMMDVIQLNIQGTEDMNFQFGQCYTGFEYECELKRINTYLGYSVHRKGEYHGTQIY